ncbi:hypothetical protein [Streptomyces sp. CHB9.2]|uniref:hypothetical protein n=1 Tax=Streptomyces sp. CHB9.2 TaxID=2841670 RepID=UPI0020949A44|nr:hypothetical protein [Streptomyces sp. CHB9.2]MCO6704885.1 hypothetical protein [Streptomyces sp. CHB9.2]
MEFTKAQVEQLTNQVVEFARQENAYTSHCVVAGMDGTPIIYLLRESGEIDNAWVNQDGQVCIEAFGAGDQFKAAIANLWLPLETKAERILRKSQEKNEKLVKAVKAQAGMVRDLHNNGRDFTQLTHVAKFGKPGEREEIVALMEGKVFCLNGLHLHVNEDETFNAELSTCAVGGNLDTRSQSLKAAIASYTDYSGNQLWDVVRVDGGVDEKEELPRLTLKKVREMLNNLSTDFDDAELGFEVDGVLKGIHTFTTIRFGKDKVGTGIVFKSIE